MDWLTSRCLLFGAILLLALSGCLQSALPQTVIAQGCTLVELRPGYPGYQGFITGVQGIGDHACLEDLERDFPRFSKRSEDKVNRRAARELGVAGSPDEWTWENWLAIEGKRGPISTCYVCALLNQGRRPQPSNTDVDRDDPRLISGRIGSTWLMTYVRDTYGAPAWLTPVDDYSFRALVILIYGEPHLNAPQLLDAYDLYGEQWVTESMKPGGRFLNSEWVWNQVLDRGGYFAIPNNASPDDQIFAVTVGLYAVWAIGATPDSIMATRVSLLQDNVTEWKIAVFTGQSDLSLGDYLISVGARDWIR